jgi:GT2 family glycosyltransferase
MTDLSIIIVNYNVRPYLEQCLDSIRKSAQGLEVETIVVDNNSSDGSVACLKERFTDVVIIENNTNCGFAKANNQGIKIAKGRYVMLLNPDTVITESTISDCIRFMDEHDDAGALGVKMLKSDGSFAYESRRGIPTPFVAFCKMSGLGTLFPNSRTFGRYYMRYLDIDSAERIDIISGACMFIRRSTLDKSGMLDEDFFMYGEDIDLSYRLLQTGKHNYYLPTRILHYKGESTQKSSYRYVYNFYNAMLIFFRKHFSNYNFLISLPIKAAIFVKAFMAYMSNLMRGKHNDKEEKLGFMRQFLFLFIGSPDNISDVEKIASEYGLQLTALTPTDDILLKGHASVANHQQYGYIIYDTSLFTYGDILRYFDTADHHGPKMAFYHPEQKSIITDNYVF